MAKTPAKAVRKPSSAAPPRPAERKPPVPEAESKPGYAVPALEKGLDVLELLATLSAPITPSQIAQRLGRSLQEVYRMVLALERRGYLVRPPARKRWCFRRSCSGWRRCSRRSGDWSMRRSRS